MIRVYCEHITPRHQYIFDFIFKDILGSECHLTNDREQFVSSPDPKINYSSEEIPGTIRFMPHGLLSEEGVKNQEIQFNKSDTKTIELLNTGTLEQLNNRTHDQWPFDPFAIAFYLVSRYEEYLPFKPDEHGRYRVENSTAYKEKFLHVPLVDAIAHELKKLLENKNSGLKFPGQPFSFVPSFDIDIAYAHLGKGWVRATAAWMKLFLTADFSQVNERIKTLTGEIKDPYDNFSLHSELAKKYRHPLLYFVLLGDFGRYDRNTFFKSERFRKLLLELSLSAEMGLHPSYRSHLRPDIFEEEKRRLGDLVKKEISRSRFHFLRLKFPESYRMLIAQGVTDDYSLGYSTQNGFRASTCTPFLFYDLQKEEITKLRLHPFIFMDSAMIDHLQLTPQEAFNEITGLVDQVKKYGGEAVGIWHNYSLSEKGQYKGWQEVLIRIMEQYQDQYQ